MRLELGGGGMTELKLAGCFSLLCLLIAVSPVHGDTGKELFKQQCESCHTVGGGDAGGPDLKGVTATRSEEWLVRVIVEPDKLTAEKDATQLDLVKKYGYEMPALGLSRDATLKIIAYLKESSPAEGAPAAANPAGASPEPVVVTAELASYGKALFTGEKHFGAGGAPCIACHAFRYPGIHGGNFGGDLTDLYEGMGEQGLRGVLKSLRFPAMNRIYEDKPLHNDEITALIAFTKDAATRREATPARQIFPWAGIGFFLVSLVVFILYKRRIR